MQKDWSMHFFLSKIVYVEDEQMARQKLKANTSVLP